MIAAVQGGIVGQFHIGIVVGVVVFHVQVGFFVGVVVTHVHVGFFVGVVVVHVHVGFVVGGVGVIHGPLVVGVGHHVPFVVGVGHLVVVDMVSLHLDLMRMGRQLQTSLQEGQWRMGAQAQDLQISSILRGLQRQKQITGVVHEIFLGTHRHRHSTHGSPAVKFIGRP